MIPSMSNLPPDSLTGAILAIEGIRDAAVLLNGPTGCKFYHGAIAEGQLPRESSYDPLRFLDEFYFGQPRVPATYLDGDDYVFGASDKLERILPVVAAKGHSLIAVVNSPGAALIGDDLNRFIQSARLDIPCVAIESTGYSGTMEGGFQEALIQALEVLRPPAGEARSRSVNLIGVSIGQKHWEGSVAELRRLLGLCGIRVDAVLSAGSSVMELTQSRSVRCNVMVHEEYGDILAAWCESNLGIRTLRPCLGAPLGFDATEAWMRGVCAALDVSPEPALAAIDEARARAVMHLKRLNSLTGLPKGATFSIRAPASIALPLTCWLRDYLGMVPVSIDLIDTKPSLMEELQETLGAWGAKDALQPGHLNSADCVFADGASLSRMRMNDPSSNGVEIALPSLGQIDVIPKSLLGAQGTLHLLEGIMNVLLDRVG